MPLEGQETSSPKARPFQGSPGCSPLQRHARLASGGPEASVSTSVRKSPYAVPRGHHQRISVVLTQFQYPGHTHWGAGHRNPFWWATATVSAAALSPIPLWHHSKLSRSHRPRCQAWPDRVTTGINKLGNTQVPVGGHEQQILLITQLADFLRIPQSRPGGVCLSTRSEGPPRNRSVASIAWDSGQHPPPVPIIHCCVLPDCF